MVLAGRDMYAVNAWSNCVQWCSTKRVLFVVFLIVCASVVPLTKKENWLPSSNLTSLVLLCSWAEQRKANVITATDPRKKAKENKISRRATILVFHLQFILNCLLVEPFLSGKWRIEMILDLFLNVYIFWVIILVWFGFIIDLLYQTNLLFKHVLKFGS